MLRLTKLSDYALLATRFLASQPDRLCRLEEICADTKLPFATLRKIMKYLVDAGVVRSHRGVNGGYELAMSARDICVADVINAVEGPIALTECCDEASGCEIETTCSIKPNWELLNHVINQVFTQISLEDMSTNQFAPIVQVRKVIPALVVRQ